VPARAARRLYLWHNCQVDLDGNQILLSLLVSGIGLVLFMYGKRQSRIPQLVTGVVLCIFPYFVSNLWLMGGITLAILFVCWALIKSGF
jgi:hypothetical protein